jgi:hypothetical protein
VGKKTLAERMAWAIAQHLSWPTKAILMVLAYRANSDSLECWPSLKTLARETSLSLAQAKRELRRLCERGLIEKTRRQGKGAARASTLYRLALPSDTQSLGSPKARLTQSLGNPKLGSHRAYPRLTQSLAPRLTQSHEQGIYNRELNSIGSSTCDEPAHTPSQDFEIFWQAYPKRSGSNPKKPALKCWQARLKEKGVTAADLIGSAKAYAGYCQATDKLGTEYVMQAKTFLGPNDCWRQDWKPPGAEVNGKEVTMRQLKQLTAEGRSSEILDIAWKLGVATRGKGDAELFADILAAQSAARH